MEKFCDRLNEALRLCKCRQSDLAVKIGVPKSAISQYVSGKIIPRQPRISQIAKTLNVNEAWLMGFDIPLNIPTDWKDIKEILLNQLALIKQESENNPDKLPELTEAMCSVVSAMTAANL